MIELKGLGGARGKAVASVIVACEREIQVERKIINDTEEEKERLRKARKKYVVEMKELYEKTRLETGKESAEIFLAYIGMAEDDIFFEKVEKCVDSEFLNIDYVLEEEKKKAIEIFQSMDDPYMKERGIDIENVCNALILEMKGKESVCQQIDNVKEEFVLVAKDLTPADTVCLDKKYVKGLVTEKGGVTSHTVILAKMLGIPAVVGVRGVMECVKRGDMLYLDGASGEIVINPNADILEKVRIYQEKTMRKKKLLERIKGEKAVTIDGHQIELRINAGGKDTEIENINDGIGLFRTEFLYMEENEYPSEERQFQVYRELVEKASGKEVIIRTLDIGGDKKVPYMSLPQEDNPFLGYRAIRICLDRTDIFKTQLRAILRASAYGNAAVMFPMIVSVEELRIAKEIMEVCKKELEEARIPYNKDIKIGIMIETPAAVLVSDRLAKEVDFFSIGTNDLIQYITASDRMNEYTQYLYKVCNPSVLRAMKQTIDNAHAAGIMVGICGESAADEKMTSVWVGLGIDELSMVPTQIDRIKYIIRNMSLDEMKRLVQDILKMEIIDEVEERLDEEIKRLDDAVWEED